MKQLKITKPVRLCELFAGIGTQAMALDRLGVPFEKYKAIEFDKYCVKSYNAIHGTNIEVQDITNTHIEDLGIVDKNKYCYIMTYSFPCQSLSVAGKMAGMSYEDWKNGNSTRSGLLWEAARILEEAKEREKDELPQILLMENVTQVHSKKNVEDFETWLSILGSLGYKSKWQDMNAKDYGIPQNRPRTFCVSWLESEFPNCDFTFPEQIPLEYTMEQCLLPEDQIEDKFYVRTDRAEELIDQLIDRYGDGLEDLLSSK